MSLRIQLLGPPHIERDGDALDLPGYRPLALLAYLLVTGKAHTRQHLVDLLFEGADDPRAALRWTLTKLRKVIGRDYILADRQQVAFDFETDYWLDVTAFEAGQVELYRGEFLEGLALRDAFRFEDWAFFERERLKSSYQQGLAKRIEAHERTGDDEAIVETAHQLLRLDNLREDWYRTLMAAYTRLGKRDAALAQFEQCRQVLKAELDVEPVKETIALAEAIRQGKGPGMQRRREERSPSPVLLRTLAPLPPRFPTSLVGRTAEMATLHRTWQKAAGGQGQILLVEGEPGIGKTRLVEELLADVADRAVILRAKCPEMHDPLAYTLFIDPLRQTLGTEPAPELSESWLAEIGRLLPELRDRYPHLTPPASSETSVERRRLFDAVCMTLLALIEQQPLILFLDDMQWADPTSLELLNHFSSRINQVPVLIVVAYRPHEVKTGHPLEKARRDWLRTGLLTSLRLAPLSDLSVAELLRELTTWQGSDPSFSDLIYRETGGNPLFVVETIANLRDEGRLPQSAEGWQRDFRAERVTIPAQVQTLIEARLNRLDDLSRQIITTAAVMRSSFRADTLQTVSGRSQWETMEGLERLLAGGLLVEQGADEFTFSHDKIRQVAYNGLSQLRRKLLHRRVAETIEKRHQGREKIIAGRLAYHYEQAGVQDKALDYHIQAGHAAREQYAHAAAIKHYQKAVALLKAQEDFEQAAQISMQLGLVQHQVFDFEGAQQAYQEAFALGRQLDRPPRATAPLSSSAPHPLRIGWAKNLQSLDPTIASDESNLIIEQLFSGLVESTPDMDVIPDVARRWEVLDGGRKYVFYLRDDVRWSDGVPVTAYDFEYAWKRVLNPATGSPAAILLYDVKGARAFHQGEAGPEAVGVQALDGLTLAIELEDPTGYFLNLLIRSVTYPVPRHILAAHGEDWTAVDKIVTNGPFRLERWRREEGLVLARNETYHGRFQGNVQKVELILLGEPWSTAGQDARSLALYKADTLDVVSLWETDVDLVRQQYPAEHRSIPTFWMAYVALNPAQPPFEDLRVRQAFALAIDQERFVNEVWKGLFTPAHGGFIPPGMPGHSAGIGLAYDPIQARRLLAEAGYPEGHHFPRLKGLGGTKAEIENLQRQWRENLGVEVEWEGLDFATVLERLDTELPSLYVMGYAIDYPDPDNSLRVFFQQMYRFNWHNEAYERLVEEAKRLTDQNKRLNLYRQADLILVEDVPLIPLIYVREHFLVKPWVRKYVEGPTQTMFWKDVIIEPHKAQPSTLPPAPHPLRLTSYAEPGSLDPVAFQVTATKLIITQLFSGLVAENQEMELGPDLAQSWEILDGGQKYILHLREDARWSDGVPVTAEDFVYAWRRVLRPTSDSTPAELLFDLKGARAYHHGEVAGPEAVGVSAPGRHTLLVELEQPSGYFLNLLADSATFPVPRHAVERYGESWASPEQLVCNGPFKLDAWQPGESMHLSRNPLYHGGFSGNVEQVEVFFSLDEDTELMMYDAGRLDVAGTYPPLRTIWQRPAGEQASGPLLRTFCLDFDMSRPPFDDERVRRALVTAIDRGRWSQGRLADFGVPALGGFVPAGMPGHSPQIGLRYDPERSRQLLAAAGYPGGRAFPAVDWLIAEGLTPLADDLQRQWAQNLGITRFNRTRTPWATLFERARTEEPNLLLGGWVADVADPDNFLRVGIAQQDLPGWRNQRYESIIKEARRTLDQRQRLELYRQADRILIEAAALMPLTYGRWHLLVKPWVKQYAYTPSSRLYWQEVIIEPHP